MQHHITSINVHYLIEVRGIGGDIALYLSSKTVNYSDTNNTFSFHTKLRVLTVA